MDGWKRSAHALGGGVFQGDDMNDYTFDYYDSDAASEDGDEEVFF